MYALNRRFKSSTRGLGVKPVPALQKISEYEFFCGDKIVTAFVLEKCVKIIGIAAGYNFDIRVLTVGNNPKKTGLGRRALKFLRPKFKKICVSDIQREALPFWVKMKEQGLVDELRYVKEGGRIYPCNTFFNPSYNSSPGKPCTDSYSLDPSFDSVAFI